MIDLEQHQREIELNRAAWEKKPLLQKIYAGFYRRIAAQVDPARPGKIVELGSGIGNLKSVLPQAITTDLFPNPWLDALCDAYAMPFAAGSVSHLVLFDVFHHLSAPAAFLREARRVLAPEGRIIFFEPFISLASFPVYRLGHHEPISLRSPINLADQPPTPRDYYAAQGNATRVFFKREFPSLLEGWTVRHAEAFSAFSYLLSGGYSKPALYPAQLFPFWLRLDRVLSQFPSVFAARCLVTLQSGTKG